MKKSLFFIYALVVAFIFTSCEGLENLGDSNVKITSPYTDLIISNVDCSGWNDGDVWLDFEVVLDGTSATIFFGQLYAEVDGVEYKSPYLGNIDLSDGKSVLVKYWGDLNSSDEHSCFSNIPKSISKFDKIEIPIIVDGSEDVKFIIFENVKIDWE